MSVIIRESKRQRDGIGECDMVREGEQAESTSIEVRGRETVKE